MSLELRCPRHPQYNGARFPGETALIEPLDEPDPARGSQACADCWELFRLKHEEQQGPGLLSEVLR